MKTTSDTLQQVQLKQRKKLPELRMDIMRWMMQAKNHVYEERYKDNIFYLVFLEMNTNTFAELKKLLVTAVPSLATTYIK